MADRGYMLSLSLFDYTDDVMATWDRPIDFADITREGFGGHYTLSLPSPVSISIQHCKQPSTSRAEKKSFPHVGANPEQTFLMAGNLLPVR
jgi:hypothetical protein